MANDATNAAIINSAGSINASILGNSGNRKAQERARKANIEFWQMQNEYNSPTAQMQRLQEAGLNPNLVYGTGVNAAGNADKIAPAQAEKYSFENPLRNITNFADVKLRTAQTDNLRTQNTVLHQDAALKASQAAKNAVETARGKLEFSKAHDLYDTSLQVQQQSLRSIQLDNFGKELQNSFNDQSMVDRLMKVHQDALMARTMLTGQERLNELRRLEINLNRLGIQKGDPWYFRVLGQTVGKEGIEKMARDIMDYDTVPAREALRGIWNAIPMY